MKNNSDSTLLASAVILSLSDVAFCFVEELFSKVCISRVDCDSESDTDLDKCASTIWKQYGCYVLKKQHKSRLCGGHLLNDMHIGAVQAMIKIQFPEIGGLKTLSFKTLQPFEGPKIYKLSI